MRKGNESKISFSYPISSRALPYTYRERGDVMLWVAFVDD